MLKTSLLFLLLFLFFLPSNIYPLEEVSSRMISLGISFTGIIEDPFTDIQRNPAYLGREIKLFNSLTIDPTSAYRAGLFLNPTPFISNSKGGFIVNFEPGTYNPSIALPMLFPLETFSIAEQSIQTSSDLLPFDLIRAGRTFLDRNHTGYPKSIRNSFYYAIGFNEKFSVGVNYLYGINGIGTKSQRYNESLNRYESSSYTNTYYRNYWNISDSKETLNSLRVGIYGKLSERYSLDLAVTASRTCGSSFILDRSYEEDVRHYFDPDTTYYEIETTRRDTNVDPFDKEVIEANLFLHRMGEKGRTSVRISFFSGDAIEEKLISYTATEDDTISRQTLEETNIKAGWTGGLAGIGGSYRLTSRPLSFYWGSFYSFARAWELENTIEESEELSQISLSSREDNKWDNHLWQFNLAVEYDISTSIAARLGGRTTAVLHKNRLKIDSTSNTDLDISSSRHSERFTDFITEASLTSGITLKITDWLKMDIYTPDISSLNSWIFESFISF
jgi:hypothetical protein